MHRKTSQSFASIIAVRLERAWNGKSPSVVRLGATAPQAVTLPEEVSVVAAAKRDVVRRVVHSGRRRMDDFTLA